MIGGSSLTPFVLSRNRASLLRNVPSTLAPLRHLVPHFSLYTDALYPDRLVDSRVIKLANYILAKS
jgi:hypothetical protein